MQIVGFLMHRLKYHFLNNNMFNKTYSVDQTESLSFILRTKKQLTTGNYDLQVIKTKLQDMFLKRNEIDSSVDHSCLEEWEV